MLDRRAEFEILLAFLSIECFGMEEKMTKTYKIEVDCANCAEKMQEAAAKTEGVAEATVSFMTQKMKVEFAEDADEKSVMKQVLKACRKVEPDCDIAL